MGIKTVISMEELTALRREWHQDDKTVAFVPTMGALHDGHLGLVLKAKALADFVIVSIFVNPTQFGPNEDFERYPRSLKDDVAKLEIVGADGVFLPNTATIYPQPFQTFVYNKVLEDQLCGAFRPGHFEGVLTVVMKLLNMVQPNLAIFGKKDYQQWRLIETMVRDLNIPVKIIGSDTHREVDGLAMSSRNRYLDAEQRVKAAVLFRGLSAAKHAYDAGERAVPKLISACAELVEAVSDIKIEYVEIRAQIGLLPFAEGNIDSPAVLMLAIRLGDVRLIDNMELG